MSNDRSDNKVIPLDPPMTDKEIQEGLDLFYDELETCKKIQAEEEAGHRKTRST